MAYTVVIVGRPNVGKSTLFNRLVGRRSALVHDTPGLTRDWREGEASLGGLSFRIIDTAGLEEGRKDGLEVRVKEQTDRALAEADLILSAEVRDGSGTASTSWSTGDKLVMYGVITNLCPMDVTFTTPSSCLFTGWSVTDSRGMGTGVAVACAGVVTSWTVAAGGVLEEGQAWGGMRADTYDLTVTADIPAGSASLAFTVI